MGSKMIGVLVLSASFMMLILIGIIVLVVHIKVWATKKEEANERMFNELKQRIDDTQNLFKKEVTNILTTFKEIIKP